MHPHSHASQLALLTAMMSVSLGASVATAPPASAAGTAATVTTTTVIDNTTGLPWTNTEQTGSSAHDTDVITPSGVPTGSVVYYFFTNGNCTTPASTTEAVTVGTTVPNSSAAGALGAGGYSYQALYGGDTTFSASISSCESFTVAKASTTTATVVDDHATNAAWSGSEQTGASAFDT